MSFLKSNINNNQYKTYSDESLFELFKENDDTKAFDLLYERYRHLVLGVSMKVLRNEAESFDNTNDVFETLVKNKKRYNIQNFKNWIYSFAKNNAVALSKKEHSTQLKNKEYVNFIEESVENEFENTLYIESEQNMSKKISIALSGLPEKQKECIELFYFKNLSYKAIQEYTSYSLKEIKSNIQNGKRKLKKLL